MRQRRSVIALIPAMGVLATAPMTGRAWAQSAQQAVGFVRSTAERLVAIVNSPDLLPEKRRKLQQVIDATVDVNDIARFCLGRFWRLATPEQQRQYLDLFGDLLVAKIAGHLGEYQGVRVTMGLARAAVDTEIVITTIDRPNNPPYQIDWVVSTSTGNPKIVDLLAGGTSLRLTQSSDFAAYLARHQYNIHELIEGMRQLIAQSG
jgi:phospholipid transport system substrate-binding protein